MAFGSSGFKQPWRLCLIFTFFALSILKSFTSFRWRFLFFHFNGVALRYTSKGLLGPDFTLSTIALILSILDWLATTILLPQMLFSNFDFFQQNFAVISKTFLDNSDRATVSVLSHSWGPSVLIETVLLKETVQMLRLYCTFNRDIFKFLSVISIRFAL